MGKYRSFLGIFASLFVLFFTCSVMAAGYTCPEYKKYTSCSTNYYMSGGQVAGNSCNQCGENSTSKGGTQSYCQCDEGYSVDGQLLNTASENTKPDDGSDCQLASVTCEPGTYFQFAKSGVGCMACVAGKWCPGGVFYWTGEEHQGVNDCPAGYTSKGGATAENECFINVEAGHYLPTENSAEPQTCAAGTSKAAHTVNYGSKSECDVCSDNQYSDAGAASCTSCNTDNGYGNTGDSASNHAGIASCTIQCPAGQYVATAGEGCVSVGDGNWSDGTEVVAQDEVGTLNQCPANYRDGAAASSQAECITSCDAGEYVETANAACTSIGTGYYKEAHTVKYGSTSSRNQCPENYRDGAPVGAEADCLGIMERIGERKTPPTPDGCADITVQACEPRTCEYQKKYGTNGDGAITQDCDSVDELSCTDTITKVEASENHYSDGLTCPACESGYTSEQGATTAVQCIKSCTVACIDPGSGACPENSSSCTWNTNESQTGTQNQVEKKCSVTAKQCTLKDFVCKTGYDKSGQTCIPHAYEVSYSCGTGTGNAPGGTSQKYNSNYYIANNTCEKPGNKFMGWNDGSKTVQPGQITWTYTQNITFTAVWQPCDEDTSAKGQCYCSANQYPNGDGSCDNCVIQCSASEEVYTLGSYDVCDNGTDDECYRSCTTSDVANSSEVSGTITKGGAGECAATSCNKNFYLSGIGCAACVPNATCPGGEEPFKCNPGYHLSEDSSSCEPDEYTITLKKNGGTGTVNGATGANDAVQTCKHGQMCTLPNGAGLERVGYAFTGWGDTAGCTSGKYQEVFTAAAIRYACWTQTFEQCQSGKYYNGSTHVTCPEGMFCPGTGNAQIGNAGCGSECPEPGTSPAGSTSNTACYITCSGGAITGGTRTPVDQNPNYDGSAYPTCKYTVTCDVGYIAKNQGTATATCEKCIDGVNCPGGSEEGEPEECPAGSYCEDGVAKECPAGGTSTAGAESITDCYKTCEPTLDIEHGQGISTGNAYYSGSAYPACQYRAQCDENYTAKDSPGTNPSCVWADPGACPEGSYCPEDGSGPIACPDGGTSDAGATSETQCYKRCDDKSIDGGTANADKDKVNWTGSAYPTCTFTVTCDAGYIAKNQGTATATCEKCIDGVNCPGGSEEGEPEECPAGSYCEDGVAKECPAGGTSAAGSESITDCYKTCEPTLDIDNGQGISTGNAYYSGSEYPACQYTANCDENYIAQDSPGPNPKCVWADPDACPAGSYCPEDGTGPIACPDGGTSDAGATSETQCYKTCTEKPITGGTANADKDKVNWTGSAYPTCTFTVTCDAGYIAKNQGTATATCEKCIDGVNCPGGSEEGEPEECPAGSYCEDGVAKECPAGGTSAAGSESITDCYKTCNPTLDIEHGQGISTGNAYYSGSEYPACQYTAQCDENYTPQNSPSSNPSCVWGDTDECPAGYYCPPEEPSPIACPNGGMSEKGSTSVTQCYKIFDDYDGFQNGTASAKCFYQTNSSEYDRCTIQEVKSCIAGYWYAQQNAFLCSGTESGFYSPAGDIHQTACPKNPTGGAVESTEYADSYTDCYMACDLSKEDISNSTSVAAAQNTVNAISADTYAACSYSVTCETGYNVSNNDTANPSCVAKTYTITLDKNGGIGSIAGSVECTFDSGNCTLPATSGLTRTGYTTGNRWCADAAGNGPCYYAGQSTGTNISADGTDTTLYAMWTPNVYTVNLDHNTATVDGAPDTVYLKYATGWFSNEDATESITKLTTVPEKSSYNFVGYYSMASNGTQIVNASGAFLTTENALTFTTDEPATIYARWSAGTTNCAAGTYYTGTGDQCVACTANHYCPGGTFATDSGSPEGLNACPQDGVSPSNSDEISDCYKTKLAYSALHGDGTQTCNYDPDSQSYSANCTDKVIEVCDAGYYLADAENENPDCDVVGTGYYNGGGSTERTQCPNGGSTETETSTMVQQCFKTGLPYEAKYGSGTQRCFYTSGDGADAIYQRDCDTKVIDSCRGGYWLENPGDTDCVEVGQNYYSDSSDTSRYACPANGKTHGTISDSILLCYKDGLPYTQAQHGTGEYLCFYTSGEGDSAVYASSCETPTMTSCDAGYYYDHLVLPTDCMEVTKGWYSPAIDTSRHQCPMGGTTATSTSAAITECYRDDMACDIENGSGEQTCNYDEADSNYTADCQTCNVTMCDEGFSQVGNTCINCPAGSVCDEGQQQTCSSLTDGMYPESDAGTDDVAMCYRDCPLADNAAAMAGRDYYDALDTCEIKRCAAGYTLDNGQCVECPEGSFCDGTTDPENPGDDVKSCADLGNGEWSMSLPGATDESGCYQTCEPYEITNGTAVPVSDKAFYPNECEYRGESDTGNPCEIIDGVCVETSCNAGYEMKDGVCVECNREFALAYKDGGVCLIAECVLGYHPNGDKCEPNIQSCEAPNAISAERVWDSGKQAFGACMIRECEYGFHLSSNACVPDTQPCEVENGSGYKEWDSATNAWGECIATLCNPGYTNDPAETNERTKQCGECKNRYSVLGKLAASSYVQGCEIASCMYQGELYNLENNECVPICPMTEYEDDTGTMVWDDSRKKCVRTCKEGYTMW